MKLQIQELPYFEDSAALFIPFADRPWSVFLDSGFPHSRQGRYDIIAADPIKTLVTQGSITEIRDETGVVLSLEDPFSLLRAALGEVIEPTEGLPFCGGALGYLGYDLARRLERLPVVSEDAEGIPDMMMGVYDWALVVDHHERRTRLVGKTASAGLLNRWPHLLKSFSQIQMLGWQMGDFEVLEEPRANLEQLAYLEAFERIQHYIKAGDCYQVNLALRFSAPTQGHAWTAYQQLRTFNPAPFAAFLNYPGLEVLSSSPERFLRVAGDLVETKPIKGTRPRVHDVIGDARQVLELRDSPKDRSENLMIVDLLRNDIGKNCAPGSVHVPHLFEIESYATVHHMVSTVRGQLRGEDDAIDLLKSCFPGGSITGAPKIRAMEIIEELEPQRRGIYCGSIAYIGFDGNMDSNIAIRTLVHSDHCLRFWAGGGIVADSSGPSEYQECYQKASAMLRLIEALRQERHDVRALDC